ncbi:MAG: DUF3386 family protein [Planctomycetia bacterium]|nr:DUF3386 family protein [Planctomycetia bacterium]
MRPLSSTIAVLLAAGAAFATTPARAHFLWVDVKRGGDDKTLAQVWFNEGPEAGSARLAAKIEPTKAWLRRPAQKRVPLALKLENHDDLGQLAATVDAAAPYGVEADYEYGIFRHDGAAVLLHYYAQHVAGSAGEIAAIAEAASTDLPLAIVPRRDRDGLALAVLWKGQPAAGCQVVVHVPGADEVERETDTQGVLRLASAPAGDYAIRARRIDKQAGDKDGQAYEAVHHYATVTFRLAAADATAATGKADATAAATAAGSTAGTATGATAAQILAAARDGRAIWDDFPGFTATVELHQGRDHARGRVTVTADGEVQLAGFDGLDLKRVQQILDSLVQHRAAGGGPVGGVSFVEEAGEHALGRMIRFDEDKELHSAYRVKDDVVTEVNRQMGPMRFTISVLDVQRNPEGKYLPTSYNVSFWDKDSGKLKASETHLNDWLRVGSFDLPRRVVVLRAEDDKRNVVSLVLSDHRLLTAGAK